MMPAIGALLDADTLAAAKQADVMQGAVIHRSEQAGMAGLPAAKADGRCAAPDQAGNFARKPPQGRRCSVHGESPIH